MKMVEGLHAEKGRGRVDNMAIFVSLELQLSLEAVPKAKFLDSCLRIRLR